MNNIKEYINWISDDITFCSKNDCKDIKCYRNPNNMRYKTGIHSISDLENTDLCPSYYKDKDD